MRHLTFAMGALVLSVASFAQSKSARSLVEFEMMTWPEVKQAIHARVRPRCSFTTAEPNSADRRT